MNRKAYIDKLAAQLKQWDDEIEKMEAKVQEKTRYSDIVQ